MCESDDRTCVLCGELEIQHVLQIINVIDDSVVLGYLCPGQLEDIDVFTAEEE